MNFDTLGSWNNRLTLPILYEQSIKTGKLIPRVPLDEIGLTSVIGRRKDNEDRSVVGNCVRVNYILSYYILMIMLE